MLTFVRAEEKPRKNADLHMQLMFPTAEDRVRIFLDGFPEVADPESRSLQDTTMRKFFRRLRRFIEHFTPGGTEYTSLGTEIHYSSKGVTSISKSDAQKILFMRLDEWKKLRERLRADSDQKTESGG